MENELVKNSTKLVKVELVKDLKNCVLTPREVLEVIERSFPVCWVRLQGIIVKEGSFIRLVDVESGAKVDLVLNGLNEEKFNLVFNRTAEVEGLLNYYRYVQGGGFFVRVNVKKLEVLKSGEEDNDTFLQDATLELEEKLRQKTYRGFGGYVQSFLEKKGNLNVAVLYGKGAQVHKDFEQALINSVGAYRERIKLHFYETSLDDESLAKALVKVKDFPMVFVLRGGGAKEELQKVGGIESAKVVLEYDIPLYLAIGHTLDKGFVLEKVADYVFATPSIAGAELGRIVAQTCELLTLKQNQEKYISEIAKLKTIMEETKIEELKKQTKQLEEKLHYKDEKIEELQWKAFKNKWLFIIMLIINLILLGKLFF